MPEVFEYQFEPDVAGHQDGAPWDCNLAGATCLAGDVFGQYQFPEPLSVGDRVVFPNSGAYTLVKAHTFNGVNLPTIYHLSANGRMEMKRRYTYEDYAPAMGGGSGTMTALQLSERHLVIPRPNQAKTPCTTWNPSSPARPSLETSRCAWR